MSWFKYSFCNSVYSMFSEFCSAANIRSHISVKMENKMKKSLSPMYSLKLKNIILFLTQTLIFILFKWSYSKPCFNVSQLVKIYVENGKVISTLSNFVQINVEILIWCCSRLTYRTLFQRLFNFVWRRDVMSI